MKVKYITLIASAHEEDGELNSNALYKILEVISPEVIFEELPFPRTKENIIKFNINSIESPAIDKYIEENNQIIHISVDFDFLHILDELKSINKILCETFKNNANLRSLNLKKNYSIRKYAYKYLNSVDCSLVLDEIKSTEKDIIANLNDEKLSIIFNLLEKINSKRENEMIKNIYKYSIKNNYNQAVFIFGVAHKNSILKNIEKIKNEYNSDIEWKLYD